MASPEELMSSFPFLIDPKTCSYISNSKSRVMFIMRGLPGSGKSTIVDLICSKFKDRVCICSTDHAFLESNGSYLYDASKLDLAHEKCRRKCEEACEKGTSVVVIDNTNIKGWELKSYLESAKVNGYVVVLVEPKTPWRQDVSELVSRNKHGVPAETITRQIREFEEIIPFYYGWFLNESYSRKLQEIADHYVMECLKLFPEFKSELIQQFIDGNSSEEAETENETLARMCYSQTIGADPLSSPLLHCTSHFCDRGKAPGSRAYHQQSDVQTSCGEAHTLTITGFILTGKTLSARVSLDSKGFCLFQKPDEENWKGLERQLEAAKRKGKEIDSEEGKQEMEGQKGKGKREKKTKTKSIAEQSKHEDEVAASLNCVSLEDSSSSAREIDTRSLVELFPELHNSGKGRSAHVTLKTATDVEAKHTNLDILSVCDIEEKNAYSQPKLYPVKKGLACYYGVINEYHQRLGSKTCDRLASCPGDDIVSSVPLKPDPDKLRLFGSIPDVLPINWSSLSTPQAVPHVSPIN